MSDPTRHPAPVARPATIGTRVAGVGLLTGWGEGPGALPADAARAAGGRDVVALAPPAVGGERFRRATRECLLGIAAVEALLREAGLGREDIRGPATALVYATAAAYAASNVAFAEASVAVRAAGRSPAEASGEMGRMAVRAAGRSPAEASGEIGRMAGTLHFPYTAPSAVPGEVAIEFGLTGPYVILLGGATAAIDALWQATRLLEGGGSERALVLAVETFAGCAPLWARGRRLVRGPLVEAAACALLVPGGRGAAYASAPVAAPLETLARRRAGETLACAPLVALALAGEARERGPLALSGEWRGRRAGLVWAGEPAASH